MAVVAPLVVNVILYMDDSLTATLRLLLDPGIFEKRKSGPALLEDPDAAHGSPPKGDRVRDLLPLPFAEFSVEEIFGEDAPQEKEYEAGTRRLWLWIIVTALNFNYCLGSVRKATAVRFGPPTLGQAKALKRFCVAIHQMCQKHPGTLSDFFKGKDIDWRAMLDKKSVSYSGEVVATAERLSAAQVLAGLPPIGVAASVDAVALATGAVREALLNPELVRLRDEDVDDTYPQPRLNLWKGELEALVRGLYQRGVIAPIAEADIWRVNGSLVLNGMFGVEKPKDPPIDHPVLGKLPALRLIMNLVPSNACQVTIDGDIGALPTASQWSTIHLQPSEILLHSASDRKCFFYIFRLPSVWRGAMTFCEQVPGTWVGQPTDDITWFCSTVVPMGWTSSVGVCQHLHRNMFRLCSSPPKHLSGEWEQLVHETCNPRFELRRDRPCPISGDGLDVHLWQLFVDNADEDEIFQIGELPHVEGTTSEFILRSREVYDFWNAPGNPDQDVLRQVDVTTLGVRRDGHIGRLDAPENYFVGICSLTFYILGQEMVHRHDLQVLGGRWIRCWGLRRSLMTLFKEFWKWLGLPWQVARMPCAVARELLSAVALLPLCYTDLRHTLSRVTTVSDASLQGGAVCAASSLSQSGLAQAGNSRPPAWGRTEDTCLLIGLLEGIGGWRRAWELLGLPIAGYCFSEKDRGASRIIKASWPDAEDLGDCEKIDDEILRTTQQKFPRVQHIVISAGFVTIKEFRMVKEVINRCKDVWGSQADVHVFLESVTHLPCTFVQAVSSFMGQSGVQLCLGDVQWQKRTRFYWTSWPLRATQGVVTSQHTGHPSISSVTFSDILPPVETWLDVGCSWPQRQQSRRLPTAIRRFKRQTPPQFPSGIELCTPGELDTWRAFSMMLPPHYFRDVNLIVDPKRGNRPPSVREQEVLLGYRAGHTATCVTSSELKHNPGACDMLRFAHLGGTFAPAIVAWLVQHLVVSWDSSFPVVEPSILVSRSCGRVSVPRWAGLELSTSTRGFTIEQLMTLLFVRSAEHRGSDVRMDTGALTRPGIWPRAAVNPDFWNWRTVVKFKWREPGEHISELELRTALSMLKWRLRSARHQGTKFLHLMDSAASIGVLTKKRSSAHVMQRVAAKYALLEIAGHVWSVFGFVRSDVNPADGPSRESVRAG